MSGYRILFVEDEHEEAIGKLYYLFPKLTGLLDACDDPDDIQAVLDVSCPYVDYDDSFEGALKKLKSQSKSYVLFIVDRDLGNREKIISESVKAIWPTISSEIYGDSARRSGDLLLEYLLLEAGFQKQSLLNHFFFLTGYESLDGGINDFLKTFHFSEEECRGLVIGKSDVTRLEHLRITVEQPIELFIQKNNPDVFSALSACAEGLSLDRDEHASNLIKALAYIEDVGLAGKSISERPSISMLRALCESLRGSIKQTAIEKFLEQESSNDFISRSLRVLSSHYDNPRKGVAFRVEELRVPELFCPPIHCIFDEKLKKMAIRIRQNYRHIHDIFELMTAISSQEIHHNERKRCDGYRLNLMVNSVCELLCFYHAELLPCQDDHKGDTI